MNVQPFTLEDAGVWANVCYRLSIRCGRAATVPMLHFTMDANWTDALTMWVLSVERSRIARFQLFDQVRAMSTLNETRAFGLSGTRVRYAEHLYRMIRDERRLGKVR